MGWFSRKACEQMTGKDLVKVPKTPYQTQGSLGIFLNNNLAWYTCRDSFQNVTENNAQRIFFFHGGVDPERVINFMRMCESICNCPEEMELKFQKTTSQGVMCIDVSEWWRYKVRRSLMTALLRCGLNFSDNTGAGFVKALYSQGYTSNTRLAIERFFGGYTAVKIRKNSFGGWQAFFGSRTKEQIDNCLVKLKKKKVTEQEVQES